LYYNDHVADDRFDLDLLDDEDPFEIDAPAAHLFKHPRLGIEDIRDVWASDPMFYPQTSYRPRGLQTAHSAGFVDDYSDLRPA
jgi:hypothetical protein